VLTKQGKIVVEGVNVKVSFLASGHASYAKRCAIAFPPSMSALCKHAKCATHPGTARHGLASFTHGCCAALQKKTVQPKKGGDEKGQILQSESPIHHSNVMLYSKEKKVRSRVGHR
jgi:ribosomal protein L24